MPGIIGVVHDWKKEFTDTVNTTDSHASKISTVLSDTTNLTDSDTKAIGYVLSDTCNLSDSDTKAMTTGLTDIINTTDIFTRDWDLAREHTETIITTESHIRLRFLDLSETFNVTDTFGPLGYGRSFTETLNTTDIFTRDWTMERAFSETINATDDIFHIKYDQETINIFVGDFTTILADIPDEDVTLRQSAVATDSLGNITTITDTDITINARFWTTTLKERQVFDGGISITGFLTGYFEPVYTVASVDYTVTEGDRIIKNSITYRVVKIEKIYEFGTTEIFIKAILQRE